MATAAEVVAEASARGALPELRALLVEPTWQEVLAAEFDKPNLKQLQRFYKGSGRNRRSSHLRRRCSGVGMCTRCGPRRVGDAGRRRASSLLVHAMLTLAACPCRAMNSCPFDAVEVVILGECS